MKRIERRRITTLPGYTSRSCCCRSPGCRSCRFCSRSRSTSSGSGSCRCGCCACRSSYNDVFLSTTLNNKIVSDF